MRITLAAVAASIIAALGATALLAGTAAAHPGRHHAAPAHRKHRRHRRRTPQRPLAMRRLGGGTLDDPVWGHQGTLLTLRPSGSLTPRPSGSLRPQAIIGNDPDDPEESGCWDANAYVANTAPYPWWTGSQQMGYVANWYSPDCGTNWAETVLTNDPGLSGEVNFAQIEDKVTGEYYYYQSAANGTYTDMTQSKYDKACATGGLTDQALDSFPTQGPGACA